MTHTLADVAPAHEVGEETSTRSVDAARGPERLSCPCCGNSRTVHFYSAPAIPVHSCILLDTPEAARALPLRDLELSYCQTCGFIFNRVFDTKVMHYSERFEESQHFSETFSGFARKLAAEIAETCDIAGKKVVEIGCGKGEFLIELCQLGHATGVGIDPGYRPDKGRGSAEVDVRFIVDFFSDTYSNELDADVILCRHTLEHIDEPRNLIRHIRRTIADKPNVWVVFETPDAKRVIQEGAFWDIYYEHCSYFSAGTHARLFRAAGLEVTGLSLQYAGQYIIQYAQAVGAASTPALELEDDLEAMDDLVSAFPGRVARLQSYWKDRLRDAKSAGRQVVLWGGGSKGVSFLTTLGVTDEVKAVVDVNPFKQGKFMPGTGHPVISPLQMASHAPDLVIVMNPIYLEEISTQVNALGLQAEVVALDVP